MSMSSGLPTAGGMNLPSVWVRMPDQTWLNAVVSFVGMWMAMMAAMMLPSLVPILLVYRRSLRRVDRTRLGWQAGARWGRVVCIAPHLSLIS
jgi:predicted metal-binding membrane protein